MIKGVGQVAATFQSHDKPQRAISAKKLFGVTPRGSSGHAAGPLPVLCFDL